MGFFGIDLPKVVASALDGASVAATLVVVTQGTRNASDLGGGLQPTTANVACRGFVDEYARSERGGSNIREGDKKIVLFAATLGSAVPKPSDSVTIEGTTYRVISVERDPAGVRYKLHARGL